MIRSRPPISIQFLLLLVLVLILNGVGYLLILKNVYSDELKSQAKTVVSNVESFGAWVARSGRVWVKDENQDFLSKEAFHPINDESQTANFFSKNPALATREYSEVIAASDSPAKFRMTSLNVMNPNNAPDEFETRALNNIINSNSAEYFEESGGTYRYAKPVFHTAACITCHGKANNAPSDVIERYGAINGFDFKVGDVAGVISVTLPRKQLLSATASKFGFLEIGLMITSILLVLWFVRKTIINPVKKITEVANKISRGEAVEMNSIDNIGPDSSNEVDQLILATSRMGMSYNIAENKMKEARESAIKAIRFAQKLKKESDSE